MELGIAGKLAVRPEEIVQLLAEEEALPLNRKWPGSSGRDFLFSKRGAGLALWKIWTDKKRQGCMNSGWGDGHMCKRDNHSCEREKTILAVLEENKLVEIYLDPARLESLVGNIYLGRVTDVLPGIQAAFIDIGMEKNAFFTWEMPCPSRAENLARSGSAEGTANQASRIWLKQGRK